RDPATSSTRHQAWSTRWSAITRRAASCSAGCTAPPRSTTSRASSSRRWTCGGSSTTTRPTVARTAFPSTSSSTSDDVPAGGIIGWFEDVTLRDRAEVGGKGGSLGELTRAGIAVPPGFVVRTRAFERFIASLEREAPVRARVAALRADDLDGIRACAGELRGRVCAAPLPGELAAALTTAH